MMENNRERTFASTGGCTCTGFFTGAGAGAGAGGVFFFSVTLMTFITLISSFGSAAATVCPFSWAFCCGHMTITNSTFPSPFQLTASLNYLWAMTTIGSLALNCANRIKPNTDGRKPKLTREC